MALAHRGKDVPYAFNRNVPVYALITFSDVLALIETHSAYAAHVKAMQAYREQYGVENII